MIKKVITLFTVATMLFSCGSGEESLNDYNDGFNRASLLQNIADNIILPSYNNLNQKLEALEVSTNNFTNFGYGKERFWRSIWGYRHNKSKFFAVFFF